MKLRKLKYNYITDIQELCNILNINQKNIILPQCFPLLVPKDYVRKIKKNNPKDPLLLQILPTYNELVNPKNKEHLDPLQEASCQIMPNILKKFHGRVLVMLSSTCAIHCRFCFRKNFNYQYKLLPKTQYKKIYSFLKNNPSVYEVILSGGDPLHLNPDILIDFLMPMQHIKSIKIIRIHSRIPIVMPDKISKKLISFLKQLSIPITLVVHCNHPNEIDNKVKNCIQKLKHPNITILNQSVLLNHINANFKVLSELSFKLYETGILPYYLHILDPVTGTNHFYVPQKKINLLYQNLLTFLPGYLVPKIVKEIPEIPFKKPLSITTIKKRKINRLS